MLGKTAGGLFWMYRYLERAENTARLIETGQRIAPQLYIACGISGASQHMAGCSGAKRLMVINTDKEAPIFTKADYAVVGDLHEVLPAISEEIRRRK